MSRTIHKILIKKQNIHSGVFPVKMPIGSNIIHFDMPGRWSPYSEMDLCIWIECDAEKIEIERKLQIFGTGDTLPDEPIRHVMTIVTPAAYVWHLYEILI